MKRFFLMAVAATLVISGASSKSVKRGVCAHYSNVKQIEVLAPGVSWYYNWAGLPKVETDLMPFEPMVWNGNFNADQIRDYVKAHPETKYLLGFNEPNFNAQANMSPEDAAAKWPEVQALAKELNLKLVAPALNYSPDTWQPIPWMDAFIKLVGEDAFDYCAIHCYGGVGVMKDLATQFYNKYGKKVLVTEFCYWPGEAGYVAPATQVNSMIESVTWLETTDFIEGYAWFMATGASSASSGPNYGLILPGAGSDERELSLQGLVYTYMSDFDKSVWNPINKYFNAVDYVNAASVGLGKCEGNPGDKCTKPLAITEFKSSSFADWQFDVPEAGDYTLMLWCSGEGDPKRWDPTLSVSYVNADGSEKELSAPATYKLTGQPDIYGQINIKVTLEAGKQTLRLKGGGLPSGINIAAINLANAAGVENVAVEAVEAAPEYYTLQGIKVAEPAEGQIYIKVQGGKATKVVF